jgi:magnesium transporter
MPEPDHQIEELAVQRRHTGGGERGADLLTDELVNEVAAALEAGDRERVRDIVEPLHPADIADLFELVDAGYRHPLAATLGSRVNADVLAEMNDWVRDELLHVLEPRELADVVVQLETDDAVAIIEDLEAGEQQAVLESLPENDRAAIEEALRFPEESAGRLMQRDLVAVPEHWTVGQVIDFLRDKQDLPTDFWEIFVVDPAHRPAGTMRLSWVLRTPRDIAVSDVMQRDQTLIPADMDQEEVALRFQKYALISAAVIDPAGRLVGVVTVDDVVHIIQEEASEDILGLSGVSSASEAGDINVPVTDTVRARIRWLVVNLGTSGVSAFVISLFSGTIAHMVALAALMPIVASSGGNAGSQTMAVTVRALALNQLSTSNTRRAILRELRVAGLNGLILGTIIALATLVVFANVHLSLVIGVAMLANNLIAGCAGVAVPLTLERFEIDPATASSIFVTMMTDVMGFFLFLGLAAATGLGG